MRIVCFILAQKFCMRKKRESRAVIESLNFEGALFHGDDELTQLAFNYEVERINSEAEDFQLVKKVANISRTDSVGAQEIVCQWAAEGIDVIFGPSSVQTSGIVASIAEIFEIPHIIYHWKTKTLHWEKSFEQSMTLNLYPDSEILAEAFANVLVDFSWKSYTIIYESRENLIRLKDILQIHDPTSPEIHLKKLSDEDYGVMLKAINSRGDFNIVLDISTDKIIAFLKAAEEVNMLGDYNNYFITNLDTHTLNLSEVSITSNITCLRLVDPNSEELINATSDLWLQGDFNYTATQVSLEAALLQDALNLFNTSLQNYEGVGSKIKTPKHNCEMPEHIPKPYFGFDLIRLMRAQEIDGITGNVQFQTNDPGSRINFKLDILELNNETFNRIGYWDTIDGVTYDREFDSEQRNIEEIQNKTFVIAVRFGTPFLMEREVETDNSFEGNDRYEGYVVDLINILQENLLFDYELEIVPDGQYGNYNPMTKKWTGLVRQLMERKADLAIADLTITEERNEVVDFTTPFMNLGIGILFARAPEREINLFSFLDPLSSEVWFCLILAFFGVSFFIFILARISREDWREVDPIYQHSETTETVWNFKNCIWLACSITGQGCNILPKGLSTRLVTCLWWTFSLMLAASYTANLAAFLTTYRMFPNLQSVEDLVNNEYIKYGSVSGGATMRFFQESNHPTYQRMWAAMERTGEFMRTKSNDEGVSRVKNENGDYAFMMESVVMEYETNRDCSIKQIGGLLNSKGYGIAFPKGSPYRKAFDAQIMNLTENGVLKELKDKWWKSDSINCYDNEDKPSENMNVANIAGAVCILIFGCAVAFIVSIFEFSLNVKNVAKEKKITYWQAFKTEIAFVFKFWVAEKPTCRSTVESSKSENLRVPLSERFDFLPETRV